MTLESLVIYSVSSSIIPFHVVTLHVLALRSICFWTHPQAVIRGTTVFVTSCLFTFSDDKSFEYCITKIYSVFLNQV